MKTILKDRYYNTGNDSKYLIQTHSQAKASRIKLPEVHGVDKGVNPNIKPERQVQKSSNPAMQPNKPRLEQGREGLIREASVPSQVQLQVQAKEETQTKEQTLSKQGEGIQRPLTKHTTVRHMEQRPETGIMSEHTNIPKVNEIQNPIYLVSLLKPPPRLAKIE